MKSSGLQIRKQDCFILTLYQNGNGNKISYVFFSTTHQPIINKCLLPQTSNTEKNLVVDYPVKHWEKQTDYSFLYNHLPFEK